MNSLKNVLIIGASMGLGERIAALFPESKDHRQLTRADIAAMGAAELKRQRKANKLNRNGDHNAT